MITEKLVHRSDFAKMCGKSPSAITQATKNRLKDACVGRRINIGHPSAIAYIVLHTGKEPQFEPKALPFVEQPVKNDLSPLPEKLVQTEPSPPTDIESPIETDSQPSPAHEPLVKSEPPPYRRGHNVVKDKKEAAELPEDITELRSLTLDQIIKKHGTKTAFLDWLKAGQIIESIEEKRIKNSANRGKTISVDVVNVGILDRMEALFIMLLTDGAKSISSQAYNITKSGGTPEQVQKMTLDKISSYIKPTKIKMANAVRTALEEITL